jgi:hypothetical protein
MTAGCGREKSPSLKIDSSSKETPVTPQDPNVLRQVNKDVQITTVDATTSDNGQADEKDETGAVAVKAKY